MGWFWLAGGLSAGAFLSAAFAAYAHQVQHERPELVFWMHPPVHAVHHRFASYRKNYGIGVDFWDKLFGTYQRVDWTVKATKGPHTLGDFIRIKWR